MSEAHDASGPHLRQLQSEMRAIRAEMRAECEYVVTFISSRAAETETLMESLFRPGGAQRRGTADAYRSQAWGLCDNHGEADPSHNASHLAGLSSPNGRERSLGGRPPLDLWHP